ncbi:MAG: sugar ABC transporter substrate-binding protein [Deltaproteobacteria bacterium]|nr:sugar ABC transporter substrate-binding protein [Deltaproteobacteria bacterium]MBW1961785.1 sugar ABC transporter substrate-binding protein [Deltaproteobacteria bacterium]MBW1995106.1 sugar ABC transporter substrate-binding protein [Deltaproteobacteria bacterium]MBW2152691.1 sugar ABC transporter substrate-binding protein [Deltaproteobacteria bacterium]
MRKFNVKLTSIIILALGLIFFSGGAASAKQVTVSYSDWQLAQDIWGRSLREAIAEFERLNPGIKVKTEPVALGQRDVKFTTAIRGGKGPDVFALDANPVKQYIKEGWVKDLTPFIEREGGKKWLADFYPVSLMPVTENGKTYGVPKNVVAMVLVYNSEIFKKAGIQSPPKTWKEFREIAKKLTKDTDGDGKIDQWGVTLVLAKACFDLRFSVVLRGHGGDFLTPDWKHSNLNSPEAREAFNMVVDMILKDRSMPPGVSQVDCNGARRLMAHKKVGMIFGTMWTITEVSGMNPDLHGWKVLEMAPVPQTEGSQSKIRSTLYQKSLFMNPNTKHPEAAWKLIKFLTAKKQMEKWFVDNNMLSCRRSVNESFAPILQSKYAAVVTEEIDKHAAFLPLMPKWPECLETFRQSLQAAVAKTKTPDQALMDAHNKIEAILSR